MKFLESSFLGKNEFWRYIVVLVIMYIIIQVVGAIPMLAYMFSESKGDPGAMAEIATSYNFGEYTLEIMVFPFIVGLLALVYLIPGFHKRPFKTVINGGKKFRWKNFFYGWIEGKIPQLTPNALIPDFVFSPKRLAACALRENSAK